MPIFKLGKNGTVPLDNLFNITKSLLAIVRT